MSLHRGLPRVSPSAVAFGTAFNQVVELIVIAPLFGQAYRRARTADTREEFIRSREATGAVAAWSSTLVGSALQSYGVSALINATGTLTYSGAAYLGGLVFLATSAPTFLGQIFKEKRPLEMIAMSAAAKVAETIGLAVFLSWWGTRTNPFN